MGIKFDWFGDRARERLGEAAAARLDLAGKAAVDTARGLVPVDTGKLRDSIAYYRTEPLTIVLVAAMPYAAAVEYGTIHMSARPYLRPAVQEAAEILKGSGATVVARPEGGR